MYTMTRLDTDSAQAFARDFEEVFYQGDYRGMAAVYTADGKLFAEGAPVVEGRPAIEEFWKQGCERGRLAAMKRSIQIHEAWASGDLGYTESTVTLHIGRDSAKIEIRGVCVWRREPDGIWRITHDISNRGDQLHPGEQPYGVSISQE
jgi:ketosteroid isomerase-like protein